MGKKEDSFILARRACYDGFENAKKISKENLEVNNTVVNYQELQDEVRRLINIARGKPDLDETYNSLFIWGPTGSGKSEIIKTLAEEENCVYHKLEIQKVPIEEIQGFPYLFDSEKGTKMVRLAHPTVLPPSDDERVWLLHLDEFNKADTESMAAMMNLILTGEIGGSADYNEKTGKSEKYRLPKRTVVVGCGNKREQEGTTEMNSVNYFDIATAERWHRNVFLEYDALSWIENFAVHPKTFKFKDEEYIVKQRIPGIIINYIFESFLENGSKKAPFLIPKEIENDGEISSTMSPRAWTLLSNNMIFDAIALYNETDKSIEFSEFFSNPNLQTKILSKNSYELGKNGKELVSKIIAKYIYSFENTISAHDILFNYQKDSIRSKIKNMKQHMGATLYLLIDLARFINEVESLDNATLKTSVVNVSTFFEESNINSEDLSVFIKEISDIEKDFSSKFAKVLAKINKKFRIAYSDYLHIDINDLIEV